MRWRAASSKPSPHFSHSMRPALLFRRGRYSVGGASRRSHRPDHPAHAEQHAQGAHDDHDDERHHDGGGNGGERPLDEDPHQAPERNVDVADDDALRRNIGRLGGHDGGLPVARAAIVRQSGPACNRFCTDQPRDLPMTSPALEFDLQASIRTIPDYPKPGIMFRDITTLLGNARAFRRAVDELVQPWAGMKIDKVAGTEARGFILGGAVAHQVSAGFIPIRKKGKLPHTTVRIAYSLEYGLDEMEMHEDAVASGERVILVDDLIATGGTAEGAVKLLRNMGAQVLAACFSIDLPDLGGAAKLRAMDVPVRTLLTFDGH